jgi:peptide/nickel transport system substrate-binding protein
MRDGSLGRPDARTPGRPFPNMQELLKRLRDLLQRIFFWHESGKHSSEFTPEPAHDHALVIAITKPAPVPRWRQLRYAGKLFSLKQRRLIVLAAIAFVLGLGIITWDVMRNHILTVPASGGRITEAIIGSPKEPNPLFAPNNDPDQDIVSLVFAGLFRRVNGSTVVPDLVERFEWSTDGKRLTLQLRTNVRFHDGEPLTSDDVVFTLNAAKDPAWHSPYATLLRGVTVERTDDYTVLITLEHPDASILDTLTIGILPAHIWQDIPPQNAYLADANLKPIGAGPYRVRSYMRDAGGSILGYTFERNDHYFGIKPFLSQVEFRFIPDRGQAEEDLRGGQVDNLAFVPGPSVPRLTKNERLISTALELPQETIAFLNVNDPLLKDVRIRQALSLVIEREDVVNAQANIAVPVLGPFPYLTLPAPTSTPEERLEKARALITSAGWVQPENSDIRIKAPPKPIPAATTKKTASDASATSTAIISTASSTQLVFTVSVPNVPDILAVADVLKRRWSLLGAKIEINAMDTETLARSVVANRNAQIVVWNVLLSPSQDLYPVWWSSEASGRGLNLSNLVDRNVDDGIEAVRAATTTQSLERARTSLSYTILSRASAVFLTRPGYGYVHDRRIRGMSDLQLGRPSDRFNDLPNWYVNTEWRWK